MTPVEEGKGGTSCSSQDFEEFQSNNNELAMDVSSDCIDKDLLGSTFVTSKLSNKANTNKRSYSGTVEDPIEDFGNFKMAKNPKK